MKKVILVVSMLMSMGIIGGALAISANRNSSLGERELSPVSQAELEAATGRDGNKCLVAVDGVVYKIEESAFWQDGQHLTSEGQAYCGADLSDTIGKSPHGKTKLQQLEQVGTFSQ